MGMNGPKHYVAIELDDDLFTTLDNESDSIATIFIPYSNKTNFVVHRMVRKFGRRLQILEMNMAMESNRLHIANRFIELRGGILWKSSPLKQVQIRNTHDGSLKRGNDMKLWEKFLEEE